jgi:hypothetical protein
MTPPDPDVLVTSSPLTDTVAFLAEVNSPPA